MYTTAGADFSTTSAMKLYLNRGLSGLKGEAHWADGRMCWRNPRDIANSLSPFWSFSVSRSTAPQSPKPTDTEVSKEELLLLSRPFLLLLSPAWALLSRLVCPPAASWLHITAETRLVVLSANELSPRVWHQLWVLNAERKPLLTAAAAMLHHFTRSTSVWRQSKSTLYPNVCSSLLFTRLHLKCTVI